jgi:hypothetical protein
MYQNNSDNAVKVKNLHYLGEKVKEMAQTQTLLQCQNYAGPPLHPKVVGIVSKKYAQHL